MNTENQVASAYDAKLARAEAIVSEFNTANPKLKVVGDITETIKRLGGSTVEALRFFSAEDLTSEIPSLPKVTARQIVAALQEERETKKPEEKPAWVSPRMVDRMSYEQLLGHYNPDEDDAVSRKLKDLSKGEGFIVFLPAGGVDVETSTSLLKEIRKGFKARPNGVIEVAGSFRRIHKVGVNPTVTFEENPIYKGRALRPDGSCDQLNRSWAGVKLAIRQLIWIVINETKECPPPVDIEKAHTLLDFALTNAEVPLKLRYPKAATLFEELALEGKLPTLKLKAGKASSPMNETNNPFTAK